jgi:hypothetical protein
MQARALHVPILSHHSALRSDVRLSRQPHRPTAASDSFFGCAVRSTVR